MARPAAPRPQGRASGSSPPPFFCRCGRSRGCALQPAAPRSTGSTGTRGCKHGPARAFEDTLALGGADAGSRTLWELHRRRAEAALARLRVAAPRPDMPRRDRYALRAAGLRRVAASAFVAGPELTDRIGAAFDWREAGAAGPSFRVDGWIDPPLYTRLPPLMIDLAAGEQRLKAPIRSTVVIRVAGKADVAVTPGQGLAAAARSRERAAGPSRATLHPDGHQPTFPCAPASSAASS